MNDPNAPTCGGVTNPDSHKKATKRTIADVAMPSTIAGVPTTATIAAVATPATIAAIAMPATIATVPATIDVSALFAAQPTKKKFMTTASRKVGTTLKKIDKAKKEKIQVDWARSQT